jgi:tetratricopeptide (TPR) repeat protein
MDPRHDFTIGGSLVGQRPTAAMPAPPAHPVPSSNPRPGEPRNFRILEEHASGGLEVVYRALDEDLNREVALKRMRPGLADDEDSRVRFLREAEVTATLEHPSIVPVHARGWHGDGRPFYIMRLIRGETLRDAAVRLHRDDVPEDVRALERHALIRRFVPACEAVAFAHSRGVIHRDLKPNNIMLGPFGETLVLDWGLAKRLGAPGEGTSEIASPLPPSPFDDPSATLPGQTRGTLGFMSPEQARGDIERVGPASDIYSLGATLYFMLTGDSPFGGPDPVAARNRLIAGELIPPRRVVRETPRALEAVCLKAMARDPEQRYASATDLADDLGRWLAGEPVKARRETPLEWVSRWTRRHLAAVAVAVVAFLVFVVALSVASRTIQTMGVEKDKAARGTTIASLRWDEERALAHSQSVIAARLATSSLNAFINVFKDLEASDVIADPRLVPLLRRITTEGVRLAETVLDSSRGDANTRRRTAEIHRRSGKIAALSSQFAAAETSYERGLALVEELLDPPPGLESDLTSALLLQLDLAGIAGETGRRDRARSCYERIVERCSSNPSSPPTVRSIQAVASQGLASLELEEGRREQASSLATNAAAELELAIKQEDHAHSRIMLVEPLLLIAGFERDRGELRPALAAIDRAREHLRALDRPGLPGVYRRSHRVWLEARLEFEQGLTWLGDPARRDDGLEAMERAISLQERLVGDQPDLPELRRELARARLCRAEVLLSSPERREQARIDATAALDQQARLGEATSAREANPLIANSARLVLVRLALGEGRPEEAARLAREALVSLGRSIESIPDRARATALRRDLEAILAEASR